MSLGRALANDMARMAGMAIVGVTVLVVFTFCCGWWCGDRWDVPTKVTVE